MPMVRVSNGGTTILGNKYAVSTSTATTSNDMSASSISLLGSYKCGIFDTKAYNSVTVTLNSSSSALYGSAFKSDGTFEHVSLTKTSSTKSLVNVDILCVAILLADNTNNSIKFSV